MSSLPVASLRLSKQRIALLNHHMNFLWFLSVLFSSFQLRFYHIHLFSWYRNFKHSNWCHKLIPSYQLIIF